MTFIITGSNGQLGQEFCSFFIKNNIPFVENYILFRKRQKIIFFERIYFKCLNLTDLSNNDFIILISKLLLHIFVMQYYYFNNLNSKTL
jgi:dTDP-4-dehydrorhamnose reductase